MSPSAPKGNRPPGKKSRAQSTILRERALQTYLNYRMGMTLEQAYKASHPARKGITAAGAKAGATREINFVQVHCAQDLQAMLWAHNLSPMRLAKELDERLQSMTTKEIVKTEVEKFKENGKTIVRVITRRDTEPMEDNTTRMRATELLKQVIMPDGNAAGPQVYVFRIDSRIKQPKNAGRSEFVGDYEPVE